MGGTTNRYSPTAVTYRPPVTHQPPSVPRPSPPLVVPQRPVFATAPLRAMDARVVFAVTYRPGHATPVHRARADSKTAIPSNEAARAPSMLPHWAHPSPFVPLSLCGLFGLAWLVSRFRGVGGPDRRGLGPARAAVLPPVAMCAASGARPCPDDEGPAARRGRGGRGKGGKGGKGRKGGKGGKGGKGYRGGGRGKGRGRSTDKTLQFDWTAKPFPADPRVAVVGGGLSGLMLATFLADRHQICSVVFDTGEHGPGGRLASRRSDDGSLWRRFSAGPRKITPMIVDHAAQYFTATDPKFVANSLRRWEDNGWVRRWEVWPEPLQQPTLPPPLCWACPFPL